MRVSPLILHGLWGPLHRMADASRSLPRSCFSRPSVTFPFCLCYGDLPSPLLFCSSSPGYPDGTAERLQLPPAGTAVTTIKRLSMLFIPNEILATRYILTQEHEDKSTVI